MTQLSFLADTSSALVSEDGQYRYWLRRQWDEGPQVLFTMLNPSTADATVDDPTIRRCIGFAMAWGYGSLAVGNLFAYRATQPSDIARATDPVGLENDQHLVALMRESHLVIAAWGDPGPHCLAGRDRIVRTLWPTWHHLGLTRNGQPRHPLYLPSTARPIPWEPQTS